MVVRMTGRRRGAKSRNKFLKKSSACVLYTCRLEVLTENWELKKPLTMAMMTSVTYFSSTGSALFLSVVPMYTWKKHTYTRSIVLHMYKMIAEVPLNPCWCPYFFHIVQEFTKQVPDVVASVYFLHLHFCVHVTVVHKIHVGNFHLQRATSRREG